MRNDIQLLELLLKDQSLSLPNESTYISWATDDYCVTDEMGDIAHLRLTHKSLQS